MNFKHYILTRYNAGIYNRPDSKEWMNHRQELFLKYCAPSVMVQENYTWIIQFDVDTPKEYITELKKHCHFNYFLTDRIDSANHFREFIYDLAKGEGTVITTRLDNDDEIKEGYTKEIQQVYKDKYKGGYLVIDFNGVFNRKGIITPVTRPRANSPFLSLISPGGDKFRSCFEYQHSHMPDHFPSLKIQKQMYVIHIHDKNLMNK